MLPVTVPMPHCRLSTTNQAFPPARNIVPAGPVVDHRCLRVFLPTLAHNSPSYLIDHDPSKVKASFIATKRCSPFLVKFVNGVTTGGGGAT